MSTLFLAKPSVAQQFRQFPKVRVVAETRIDWMHATLRYRLPQRPEGTLDGYDSTRQRYVLYAPKPDEVLGQPMPLILFISNRSTPIGWGVFGPTCVRRGVIFAEPLNAGKATPKMKRGRIVLDVLDDLRRRYHIDPDRTYIAGFSSGGELAATIALALPEYFGGVVASNSVIPVPSHPSQLERLRRRLSIVMFAGDRERIALSVGKLNGPIFAEFGVRSQHRLFQGLGHHMPNAIAFDDAFVWLEDGLSQRRAEAVRQPSSRIAGAPTRAEQASLFLNDAKKLVETESRVHHGLASMDSIAKRWPDLKEGEEAKNIFEDYKSKVKRPWEKQAKNERLARTRFLAELYDSESAGIGLSKVERAVLAQGAIANWQIILADSDDESLLAEARSRIAPLEKLVRNMPGKRRDSTRRAGNTSPDSQLSCGQ